MKVKYTVGFVILIAFYGFVASAVILSSKFRSNKNWMSSSQESSALAKQNSASPYRSLAERRLQIKHHSSNSHIKKSKARRLLVKNKGMDFKYSPGFAGMPFPPFMMNGPHFHPPYNITLNALPTQNWKLLDDKADMETAFAEESFDDYKQGMNEVRMADQEIDKIKQKLQTAASGIISEINKLRVPQ